LAEQQKILDQLGISTGWANADAHWQDTLIEDIAAGKMERPFRFSEICADEMVARKSQPEPAMVTEALAQSSPAAHRPPSGAPTQHLSPTPAATAQAAPSDPPPPAPVRSLPSRQKTRPAGGVAPYAPPTTLVADQGERPAPEPDEAIPETQQLPEVGTPQPVPNDGSDFRHRALYRQPSGGSQQTRTQPLTARAGTPKQSTGKDFVSSLTPRGPAPTPPRANQQATSPLIGDQARHALRGAVAALTWPVEKYASFCRKLEVRPQDEAEICGEFGVSDDPSILEFVHTGWRERLATNDELRKQFEQLLQQPPTL